MWCGCPGFGDAGSRLTGLHGTATVHNTTLLCNGFLLAMSVRRNRMNSAVDRAVNCIWERYSDQLSLADMARSAMLSRFHFARVFEKQTGVSPGRFLAAVRIYQAKRLLLLSSMSVGGVSSAVGYSSLGSFTSHFTDSVGISPSRFRDASHHDRVSTCRHAAGFAGIRRRGDGYGPASGRVRCGPRVRRDLRYTDLAAPTASGHLARCDVTANATVLATESPGWQMVPACGGGSRHR